jgi:hypothetical protein
MDALAGHHFLQDSHAAFLGSRRLVSEPPPHPGDVLPHSRLEPRISSPRCHMTGDRQPGHLGEGLAVDRGDGGQIFGDTQAEC